MQQTSIISKLNLTSGHIPENVKKGSKGIQMEIPSSSNGMKKHEIS